MSQPIKVIITGSTGMVGEGVLHVALQHDWIEAVLVINRKPCGVSHPKLKEIIHQDFLDLSGIAGQLTGYNACFFCLGVSSIGMKEDAYTKMTYQLTMHVAQTLCSFNEKMTFCYVSGAGTDSTEKGRSMWARVKGKTENDLMKLPFGQVFALRPGFIKPITGMKHTHKLYNYVGWVFIIGRKIYAKGFCAMEELALAMIYATRFKNARRILDGDDIIALAAKC